MRQTTGDWGRAAMTRRIAQLALLALLPCASAAQTPPSLVTSAAPATTASPRPPTATATPGSPAATPTITPSATPSATATPTLAQPSDAVALVIYGVIVGGAHPWLRAHVFPGFEAPLRRLYEPRELQPIWVADGKPTAAAMAMLAAFDSAESRGLSAPAYDVQMLRAAAHRLTAAEEPSPEEIAYFDTALSLSTMRYLSDTHIGRIDPRRVDFPYDAPRRTFDPAVAAREIAGGAEPLAALAALDPPFPQYARLRDALGRYRALAARTDLAVPRLPTLRPGDTDDGVPALRTYLAALGDLPADAPPVAPQHAHTYDAALVQAVKHFQARNGLAADGVVGAATLQALQVPLATRVEQIQLAMERLRWLPYRWPRRFIVVNIPEFRLRAYTTDAPGAPLEMKVVVGEAALARKHKTPVLMADMRYLVFRPYWIVPSSIVRTELAPKIANDPSYLERNHMEMRNGRIRQLPGTHNSLGLVKFIFPNPHHVYLHDTPSKSLFARTRRDFSHGCIRVADSHALAAYALAETPGWDAARIARAMTSGPDNRHVPLATPIPVYLLYATAVADDAGQVHFFDDIYGHDASLQRQLAKGYPY
jgi:murein L,D-transpeptidase YcbB/YkuD